MAIKANITIDQGADFSTTIDVTDEDGNAVNLSGFTGASQMRKHYTSSASTNLTVNVDAVLGTVTLSMSSEASANLAPGRYVYDCEITDGSGIVTRLVEGIVTVTPNVTRA